MHSRYLQLLRTHMGAVTLRIIIASALAGVAQGAVMTVINSAGMGPEDGGMNYRLFVLFVITIGAYIFNKHYAMTRSTSVVENIVSRLRNDICDRIRHGDLVQFEKLGGSDVYTTMNRDTTTLSDVTLVIISSAASTVMLLFSFIYIAVMSTTAFLVSVVLTAIGVGYYMAVCGRANQMLRSAYTSENRFFELVSHQLDGFKEIKMHTPRSDDLYENYLCEASRKAARLKARTSFEYIILFIFSQTFFYILMAAIIFILPAFTELSLATVTKLTAVVLFIIGPLGEVVNAVPCFNRAEMAVANLLQLQERLVSDDRPSPESPAYLRLSREERMKDIVLSDIQFTFLSDQQQPLFTLGPCSLDVKAGETLFIVGGNGSGKSTFLKLLTGLYHPHEGQLAMNGIPVDPSNITAYRNRFSTVFTDFHLFDRLYGIRDVDEQRVQALLDQMQIAEKTAFVEGHFTNRDLSTGQRKRLALIASLLEDREIYVFDEVAADQDPEFRQYFYHTILKELKAAGKTVIAVTHDDRYFSVADRVVKMDFGRIVPA